MQTWILPLCQLYAAKIIQSIRLYAPKYSRLIALAPEQEINLREILLICAKNFSDKQKFVQFCKRLTNKILSLTLLVKFKAGNAFSFRMEFEENNKIRFTIKDM